MADIDGLKQRIELIDLRLKTAHSTRERESAALVEMWEQIRERFQSQNAEILSLRERIRVLEDARDDLQNMVDSLLGAVEGGLERMSDETVSNIREMASELLSEAKNPAPFVQEPPASDREDTLYGNSDDNDEAEDDDFLAALERSASAATNPELVAEPEGDDVLALDTPIDAPVSAGIQDLITRIEDSVGETVVDNDDTSMVSAPATTESPEELKRDLLEIEELRNELLGLRKRVS